MSPSEPGFTGKILDIPIKSDLEEDIERTAEMRKMEDGYFSISQEQHHRCLHQTLPVYGGAMDNVSTLSEMQSPSAAVLATTEQTPVSMGDFQPNPSFSLNDVAIRPTSPPANFIPPPRPSTANGRPEYIFSSLNSMLAAQPTAPLQTTSVRIPTGAGANGASVSSQAETIGEHINRYPGFGMPHHNAAPSQVGSSSSPSTPGVVGQAEQASDDQGGQQSYVSTPSVSYPHNLGLRGISELSLVGDVQYWLWRSAALRDQEAERERARRRAAERAARARRSRGGINRQQT